MSADRAAVERTLEAARLAVLKARACAAEWMASEADAAGDGGDRRWSDLLAIEQAAQRAEAELETALIELEERAAAGAGQ